MNDKYTLIEDLKFEVGSIGKEIIPEDKRDILIGSGNFDADIIFIADEEDFYTGDNYTVASNSSGAFLLKLLDFEDLNPEIYYLTTLSKRPVKFKIFLNDDRRSMIEILEMQIAIINPKIIVLLGKEPFNALIKNKNYNEYRGSYIDWKGGIKVLTTYEIGTVMRARYDEGKKSKIAGNFWTDLKSLKGELHKLKERNKSNNEES